MILFQLEETLGSYVVKHGREDSVLTTSSNENIKLHTVSDIIDSSYLDEIFRFSLDVSKDTNDYTHIANAICHWHYYYLLGKRKFLL